jgi:hypothetical protein
MFRWHCQKNNRREFESGLRLVHVLRPLPRTCVRVRAPWLARTNALCSSRRGRVDATRSRQTVAAPAVRWDASWQCRAYKHVAASASSSERSSLTLTAHAYRPAVHSVMCAARAIAHRCGWSGLVIASSSAVSPLWMYIARQPRHRAAGGLAVSLSASRGLPCWYGLTYAYRMWGTRWQVAAVLVCSLFV